ncbi:hypothetical protein J7E82_14450 [Arthrobacter sp. ISL-30]|nr:hypothetical protein [Arthrobacter sp. ISL-30]
MTLTVADRQSLERDLDEAVSQAISEALKEGNKGILVTRCDYRTFKVELSEDVPFGTIAEAEFA